MSGPRLLFFSLSLLFVSFGLKAQSMKWVLLPNGDSNASCASITDCTSDLICYGLEYTPANSGVLTSYTTGFLASCTTQGDPISSNASCVMTDNSEDLDLCTPYSVNFFNSSGNSGASGVNDVTAGVPVIIHQVCFDVPGGESITIDEEPVTDLTANIDLSGGTSIAEFPSYSSYTVTNDAVCQPPVATNNHDLGNNPGPVTQQVVTEDDGAELIPTQQMIWTSLL